jgi:2-keto-3-deoxy-galactonokinase
MVGSNVGWKIAPYLPVPAAFSAIGEQLTAVGDNIWIIPGLCVSRDDNHNVMRGEETQLLGARAFPFFCLRDARHPLQMGAGRSPANPRFSHRDDR